MPTEFDRQYTELLTRKKTIQERVVELESVIEDHTAIRDDNIKARYILGEISRQIQERVQARIEKLVTLALRSVFDRNFRFKLKFERKRNKYECQPLIMEGEQEYSPENDGGGSVVDIISFAFRVVLWSLQRPKTRNTFILDEPMKNVGNGVELDRAAQMFKEVSEKLRFQLIIITHSVKLMTIADRAWQVEYVNGRSNVKLVKGE